MTLVAAVARGNVIGADGTIPWTLPEDLRLFRELTTGGILVMGRHTFNSLPGPLAGRINLVISRRLPRTPGVVICSAPPAALALVARLQRPTFIIGGENVYRQFLPLCKHMVISHIDATIPGDTFFPEIDWTFWETTREDLHTGFRRRFYDRREATGQNRTEPGS